MLETKDLLQEFADDRHLAMQNSDYGPFGGLIGFKPPESDETVNNDITVDNFTRFPVRLAF